MNFSTLETSAFTALPLFGATAIQTVSGAETVADREPEIVLPST